MSNEIIARNFFEAVGVKTTLVHLSLPPNLSYEDYESLGAMIGVLRDASNWWLGEWFLQGERLYGEKVAQAVESTGRSPQTIMNVVSVCNRVHSSVRHKRLSFSHHAEVAALEPADQKRWLDEAEEKALSKAELRSEIRANGNVHPAEPELCPSCGRPL